MLTSDLKLETELSKSYLNLEEILTELKFPAPHFKVLPKLSSQLAISQLLMTIAETNYFVELFPPIRLKLHFERESMLLTKKFTNNSQCLCAETVP